MIPVNDSITAALVAMAVTAGIAVWACRGFWRARAEDAYQDGHAAGIATQIARQRRALGRRWRDDKAIVDAYLERARTADSDTDRTEIIAAQQSAITIRTRAAPPPPPLRFPEDLPDGLREYAAGVLAAADQHKWRMIA